MSREPDFVDLWLAPRLCAHGLYLVHDALLTLLFPYISVASLLRRKQRLPNHSSAASVAPVYVACNWRRLVSAAMASSPIATGAYRVK
jgi:hypothetical protein